jgi:choline dehydrogenase-like flavoprotein
MKSHQIAHTHWDAIIIGTGMGGGTIGRALAEAGKKVLFLEMGAQGVRQEVSRMSDVFVPQGRLARGLWPHPLDVTLDGESSQFYAPLGAGVGGSSAFYAATLERPERHDLDALNTRPHPTGGWPVGYDALAPWYDRAAQQYRVYGDADPLSAEPPLPLRPVPALNRTEDSLMQSLRACGLHPYHAHTGIERVEDCLNCLGHKCPKACKWDGRSAGVEPALATGNAELLDRAQVVRLISDAEHVTRVLARVDGRIRPFTADRFILSAGALGSPRLLMASPNDHFPNGLANGSGLVGRNLMFHMNELFALWPRDSDPDDGPTKAISLRDFYYQDGQRLGTVQAMGIRASYGEILHFLNLRLARSRLGRVRGMSTLARIPALVAERMLGAAQIFVGIMEDLPYAQNRVRYDPDAPDRLLVEYHISDELRARRDLFRRHLKRGLKGHWHMLLGFEPQLNWGHPCGTLRFGHDPNVSVLRPDCRTHDLNNLWVVDASFMPTSMGVNPSLTIAANALRVADHILQEDRL